MLTFTDDAFTAGILAETGIKPEWAAEAFDDLDVDVRQSIARITASPFVVHKDVRGFVFDVATGLLREVVRPPARPATGAPQREIVGVSPRHVRTRTAARIAAGRRPAGGVGPRTDERVFGEPCVPESELIVMISASWSPGIVAEEQHMHTRAHGECPGQGLGGA